METTIPSNSHHMHASEVPAPSHDGAANLELLAQFQQAMAQWLELQKEQQQTNQRFLDAQQAVMLACLGGVPLSATPRPVARPAAPIATVPPRSVTLRPAARTAAPVARQAARPPAPAAAAEPLTPAPQFPAAVASAPPVRVPTPVPVAPESVTPSPPPQPSGDGAATAPPPHPPAASNGAPPVEAFRADLLQAISDRTGYPIEMLDEKLQLEAGLGIDSIKTIEIFGLLSQYHAYLPGASEDQEESLAAFARLRTIGDILTAYETNRRAKQSNGHAAVPLTAAAVVERATLQAVEAPLADNGEKKKSTRPLTSS